MLLNPKLLGNLGNIVMETHDLKIVCLNQVAQVVELLVYSLR